MALVYVYFIALVIVPAFGLDEAAAKERECLDAKTAANFNVTWFNGVPKWYFPLWSKLDLYRNARDIMGMQIADIKDTDLVDACAYCDDQDKCGFKGKVAKYTTSWDDKKVLHFKADTKYAEDVISVMTLTDNKKYAVAVSCWKDKQGSNSVYSTTKKLSPEDIKAIKDHLKGLGFKLEFLVETPDEKCA